MPPPITSGKAGGECPLERRVPSSSVSQSGPSRTTARTFWERLAGATLLATDPVAVRDRRVESLPSAAVEFLRPHSWSWFHRHTLELFAKLAHRTEHSCPDDPYRCAEEVRDLFIGPLVYESQSCCCL